MNITPKITAGGALRPRESGRHTACVTVTVLSREGNGQASAELLSVVEAALNDENTRPVADRVPEQTGRIDDYESDEAPYMHPGP
ncbi:baseplate assembly protein J, partial [Yersinia enterocolitica subsp. palearctica YE-150]